MANFVFRHVGQVLIKIVKSKVRQEVLLKISCGHNTDREIMPKDAVENNQKKLDGTRKDCAFLPHITCEKTNLQVDLLKSQVTSEEMLRLAAAFQPCTAF